MRPISTEGFDRPRSVSAGAAPMLQWIGISDLVVDPSYQRPIVGRGRKNVDRIAKAFSWSCFAPVVVSPVEGGKFAVIDGQHRTTAAALAGFDSVPCQVVVAAQHEQAAAFKAINGVTTPISRMALHAAALVAGETWAQKVAEVSECADVELLRYPLPVDKQRPGQTMAVGAITQCLKRYGSDTVITALQCVTQTANNKPGMLSAQVIKALCSVLHENQAWRDAGLVLLEGFDRIDLGKMQAVASTRATALGISRAQALAEQLQGELAKRLMRPNAPEAAPAKPRQAVAA